jgi:murein DD-endopeptidase MepM/ murein hydrolase activator NlpD
LLDKLKSGAQALTKPLPPPPVVRFTPQQLAKPRIQQAFQQSQPLLKQAQLSAPLRVANKIGTGIQEFKNPITPQGRAVKKTANVAYRALNAPEAALSGVLREGREAQSQRKIVQPLRGIYRGLKENYDFGQEAQRVLPNKPKTAFAVGLAASIASPGFGGKAKGAKKVIRAAEKFDLSPVIKNSDDVNRLRDFLDTIYDKGLKKMDPKFKATLASDARRIVEKYGINPEQSDRKLATIVGKIVDNNGRIPEKVRNLLPRGKQGVVTLRNEQGNRYAGSRPKTQTELSQEMIIPSDRMTSQSGAINIGEGLEGIKKTGQSLKRLITGRRGSSTAAKGLTPEAGQLPSSALKPTQPQLQGITGQTPKVPLLDSSVKEVAQQPNAVNKVIQALKEAKPIRGAQEKLYSAERSRRVGQLAGVQKNLPSGEQGYYKQLGQLKGPLPKAQFESIRGSITQDDVNELFNTVRTAQLTPFEKINAETGLMKLIRSEGGQVPTTSELNLLREVFPEEFIKAIEANRGLLGKGYDLMLDVANIPRSVMTVADISAPGRQGIFNIGRKEWWQNLPNAFKYAFSEGSYQQAMQQIKTRPSYLKMREAGLALTDLSGNMSGREERFMSTIAERVPGFGRIVRASGRSYTGFLTKLRADMFDNIYTKGKQAGVGDEMLDSLGRFINSATGRGDVGSLGRISKELNAVFFSPRLLASRLNLVNPYYYYKLDPFVRKEALKTLGSFMGISAGILTVASVAGAEVVTDARNSDFAKIKVGNTRYDILGGFQQPLRTAYQLWTGEHVSSTTGRVTTVGEGYKPLSRTQILARFLESKEAPVVSLIQTLWDGTNFMGEPVNLPTEVAGRLMPMIIQDAYELYKESGDVGVFMAIPAVFGVSAQTYGTNEPSLHVTPSGKVTVKEKPITGLAEDLSAKFFPKKPKAKEEIAETLELLKSGTIDKEAAKGRIKQSLLKEAARKVNTDPEKKKALAPLLVQELKKSLKSDVTSVAKDSTLTIEEKKTQIRLLMKNFKKAVGDQPLPQKSSSMGTKNILANLGPITGIDGSSLWRWGLDIDLKKGDPVPSPISGQVVASGFNGGFGNQVKILGDDGREYWLSHLAKGVAPGQRIAAGQIVGLGGNTGNTIRGRGGDGSHLDLTVVQNGRYLPARSVAQLLKSYG